MYNHVHVPERVFTIFLTHLQIPMSATASFAPLAGLRARCACTRFGLCTIQEVRVSPHPRSIFLARRGRRLFGLRRAITEVHYMTTSCVVGPFSARCASLGSRTRRGAAAFAVRGSRWLGGRRRHAAGSRGWGGVLGGPSRRGRAPARLQGAWVGSAAS